MRRLIAILPLLVLAGSLFPVAAQEEGGSIAGALPEALRGKLVASLGRGLEYLEAHQKPDGSWEHDIGITSLAVRGFLKAPGDLSGRNREGVDRALAFIAEKVKEDGGIYVRDLPNYYTAVAMQALLASGREEYRSLIEGAQGFLVGLQATEGAGYEPSDQFYGGIGYGADLRPDLANLEYALSALKESALPADHPLWEKAISFIQRTQNRSESNDQEWAGNDGGFVYYPGFSYGGETRSYGSMTYAGLLSYSYANVTRDDPRVAEALDWIRENYSVEENPNMGLRALYYYYMVFAKALDAYGESILTDKEGGRHAWRQDLGGKLLELQHDEGYWVNEDPTWWQDNKVLVTAFTCQALEHVLDE